MADEFMTVAEIAAILKLNQQTIRNWIDAGRLPALHVGRRVRIKRSDFDELIRQSEHPSSATLTNRKHLGWGDADSDDSRR